DNFNVEQSYYNKWYGDQLIYRRPKPKPEIAPLASDSAVPDVEPVDPAEFQDGGEQNLIPDTESENNTDSDNNADAIIPVEPDVPETQPQEEEQPVEQAPPPPAEEPVIEGQDDGLGF
ncbi:unnamed protein product, partial [Chrysoparadoxa australica]